MDVEYASNALANSLFGFWTFSFFVGVQRILTFLLCDFMVGQNGSMCTESPFCIEDEWTKQSYPSQLGNKLQRTRENIECFMQWKGTSDQSICRRPKQHCGAQNFWLLPTSDEANCSHCKTPVKRWLANRSKRLSDQIIKNGIHWSPKQWFHCKGHVGSVHFDERAGGKRAFAWWRHLTTSTRMLWATGRDLTQIYIVKIAATCILVIVVKWCYHANVLLKWRKRKLTSRRAFTKRIWALLLLLNCTLDGSYQPDKLLIVSPSEKNWTRQIHGIPCKPMCKNKSNATLESSEPNKWMRELMATNPQTDYLTFFNQSPSSFRVSWTFKQE